MRSRASPGRGSSPHARGAQPRQKPTVIVVGIIPACAGSTWSMANFAGHCQDHPRMRGEHARDSCVMARPVGSSPHARGARVSAIAPAPASRIIPACAGSTFLSVLVLQTPRDHPRMREEHSHGIAAPRPRWGSSPHAQGALLEGRRGAHLHGIIPACAGSTTPSTTPCRRPGDHPRMRGEHSRVPPPIVVARGSSPHARGAPQSAFVGAALLGIIPACAGSTGYYV